MRTITKDGKPLDNIGLHRNLFKDGFSPLQKENISFKS